MTSKTFDPGMLSDLLPAYYKRLFPFEPYFRWLSYGNSPTSYFVNREFSFTLKDDVYLRYQSFNDRQDMEREIQKRCPFKIDVGAVYSHRPKDHRTVRPSAFQALEKELVLDIDLTDYDDVRACCSGADVCEKCWPLMRIAVRVLDRALRDDLGFEHVLWVFSGRRGIHCWICDEVARKLSQGGRTAVAEYLNIVKGGENQLRKVKLDAYYIHPSIQEALKIVEEAFDDYACQQQDFLADEKIWLNVLALIPSEDLRKQISADFIGKEDSASRWCWLKKLIKMSVSTNSFRECHRVIEEIMLQYCYPRLDVNVSIGVNHLLKSPFCIHPKTGRLCIPIDPNNVAEFSPLSVPTLTELVEELNRTQIKSLDEAEGKRDYKSTSMSDGVELFEKFVKKLEHSWHCNVLQKNKKMMEF